jgi:hypothetical protein
MPSNPGSLCAAFHGRQQHLRIQTRRHLHDLRHGIHRQPRGLFPRFGAAHAIGENIQPAFRFDQAVIFIIAADTALVRHGEGFQHSSRLPSLHCLDVSEIVL